MRRFTKPLLPLLALAALTSAAPLAPARAQAGDEQLAAASALYDAHKFAEAAKTLDAFLAAHPKSPKAGAAALTLGRCRSELKQFAQAVPAYEKAVATKEPAVLALAELGLGEAALRTSQWAKAQGALQAATALKLTADQKALAWDWLGQVDYQLGQFGPSEKAYLKVTQQSGDSDYAGDAWFGAGLAALKLGHSEDAHQRLRTVVDRYPQSPDRAQSRLLLAQLDLDAKRYGEARQGFEATLAEPGADKDSKGAAQTGLIAALLGQEDYPAAASRIQAALAKSGPGDPQRPRLELALGHCQYRQKQYAPALAAYQGAAKSPDKSLAAEATYWAGNCQAALNRPAEAAALFGQVAKLDPKSPFAVKARTKAGSLLANSDDPTQISAGLQNAAPSERGPGTLRLARLYLDKKQNEKAAATLTAFLGAAPKGAQAAEAQYLLGLALDAQNKSAPAAKALAAAVADAPGAGWAADAQTQLAWLYVGLKQPALAEKAAGAALGKANTAPALQQQARLALVQADLDQNKWDAALAVCDTLLQSSPSPETAATVQYIQASVSEQQKKPDAASRWEKFLADHPDNSYAAEALLHVADARFAASQFDDARQKYADLLAHYPKSDLAADAQFKLGSSLYNLTRYAEAAQAFDKAAGKKAVGGDVPESLYWAGASYEKAGNKPTAIARLSRLVREFPASPRVAKAKVRLAALKAVG